jgi:hypothetical protein
MEAFKKFGCTKLSNRIGELEDQGIVAKIYRRKKKVKTRYGKHVSVVEYSINKNG